ncbi:MAG TPA: DUF2304 domain-containing protein [Candidatus Pelethosoma merdigallinarum]|nr:DUF2304 domain-containing protein [Candidatus Pelethosoma merdigallinarum]
MTMTLRISLVIFAIVLTVITTVVLRKGRIPIKYSLLWYFCAFVILLVSIIPFALDFVADLLGFATISNLIIGILITLLLFLTMSLTIITSGQKKKITLLIQEVSMLKNEVHKK